MLWTAKFSLFFPVMKGKDAGSGEVRAHGCSGDDGEPGPGAHRTGKGVEGGAVLLWGRAGEAQGELAGLMVGLLASERL